MGANISYMGTKRQLAPAVSAVIATAKGGILLDAFSGMCTVGEAVGPVRPIWTNDTQLFAAEVGAALFTSRKPVPTITQCTELIYELFQERRARLRARYIDAMQLESLSTDARSYSTFASTHRRAMKALSAARPKDKRRRSDLFARIYAGSFLGVRQSIETDSIVGAIHDCVRSKLVVPDTRRWMLLALGRALIRTATSTGHFAQYLHPKPSTFRLFSRQRRRRIWVEFLAAIEDLQPVGNADWRRSNRAFHSDALALLPRLRRTKGDGPSVIYADPPYTDDQYSRYYHLLDTLILYDYPEVIDGSVDWRPTFYRRHSAIVAVEVAETLYPEVLKRAIDDICQFDGPITVYQACPLDIYQSDPKQSRINLLRDRGFGIITVDNDGHVTIQHVGIPLAQNISPAQLDSAMAGLTKTLKTEFRSAYGTYRANVVQGLQQASQIVEGLLRSFAKQAATKTLIPTMKHTDDLAKVIDELYNCAQLQNYRAAFGAARSFAKNYRNASSHPATSARKAATRIRKCRAAFLEAIEVATNLSQAGAQQGYRLKAHVN